MANERRKSCESRPTFRPNLELLEDRLAPAAVDFRPAQSYASGGFNPASVAVADFNNDGNDDLVAANYKSNVGVRLGNGSGGFAAPVTFPIGDANSILWSVAVGDFNNDGNADLAVTDIGHDTVGVLLGDGRGGFADIVTFSTRGAFPYAVTVGDFNNDGNDDLAAANQSSGTVGVLLGNGTGGFATASIFATGGVRPYSVAVGDFNNDRKADLAVANSGNDTVGVLRGAGNGGFFPAVTFASGGRNPQAVAVGDFNQDGNADLAVANEGSDNVGVLSGDGGGGFAAAATFASADPVDPMAPMAIAVGDFNNDGAADVAVANYENTVGVLQGDGSGSFAAALTWASGGANPISVAVGDFNNDGKPDLALANFDDGNLGVLLNATRTNRPPVANPDAYTVDEDGTLTVAAPGVLANDTDADGNPLRATLMTGPAHAAPSGFTLNALNGSFTYTPAAGFVGTDSFIYRSFDGVDESADATVTITVVRAVRMEGNVLVIHGTDSQDLIRVCRIDAVGNLKVSVNSKSYGPFRPARVVIHAAAGNDRAELVGFRSVNSILPIIAPVVFYGGAGNDSFEGGHGTGNNILFGEAGADNLRGGAGRDLVIGGLGADLLNGNAGDDLLIGGTTLFDADLAALDAVMAEWTRSDAVYRDRAARLKGAAGGRNSTRFLTSATVHDDAAADTLLGGAGKDWFFALMSTPSKDTLADRNLALEFLTLCAPPPPGFFP